MAPDPGSGYTPDANEMPDGHVAEPQYFEVLLVWPTKVFQSLHVTS